MNSPMGRDSSAVDRLILLRFATATRQQNSQCRVHDRGKIPTMKHRRLAAAMSLLAAGATVLSGCEVPHTSMAYASVVVSCGGKSAISASGSTAQANAMKGFVSAYSKSCPGHSLNYTANGSGAGIADFLAGKSDFAGS